MVKLPGVLSLLVFMNLFLTATAFAVYEVEVEDKIVRYDPEKAEIEVRIHGHIRGSAITGDPTYRNLFTIFAEPDFRSGLRIGNPTRREINPGEIYIDKATPYWILEMCSVLPKCTLYRGLLPPEGIIVDGTVITAALLERPLEHSEGDHESNK